MKPAHLHSIDTLRGLGALIICFYHAWKMFAIPEFAKHGYMVVDFFFVLSGFVMTYSYEGRIQNGESFKDFAFARFSRLYPVYLLCLLIGAANMAYGITKLNLWHNAGGQFFGALGLNLLILPSFATAKLVAGGPLFAFGLQAWAVFWEFVVSFAFYFWIRTGAKFSYILWAIFAIALFISTQGLTRVVGGWDTWGFVQGGLRAFVGLFGGYISAKTIKTWYDGKNALPLFTIAWALIGLSFWHIFISVPDNIYFEYFMVYLGFPILVGTICHSKTPILNNPIASTLGKISYSLYLLHMFMLSFGVKTLRALHIKASLGTGIIWMIAVLIIAYVFWRFVEIPARNALVSIYKGKSIKT